MENKNENNDDYIKKNKTRITKLLIEYKYQEAFHLLIILLNKVNNDDRDVIIKYFNDFIEIKYSLIGNTLNPAARF
jgi:hypothetical protein